MRLPPEFAAAAERFPLLYHKQFYTWVEHPHPAVVERRDLAEFLMRHYRAGRALQAWLNRALGRV